MKKFLLPLAFCLLAAAAHAQKMRDYSLSPQESFTQGAQPAAPQGAAPLGGGQPVGGLNYDSAIQQRIRGMQTAPGRGNFISLYCAPNAPAGLAGAAAEACLARQMSTACRQFQALPADIQQVLDDAVACMQYAAGNALACSASDSERLALLKHYWQDKNTAEALLYLPDVALLAEENCMRGSVR